MGRGLAAVLLATSVIAGCSARTERTGEVRAQSAPTLAEAELDIPGPGTSTTVLPPEPAPYSTEPISLTSSDGWVYRYRPTFAGHIDLGLSKEATPEGAGRARLVVDLLVPDHVLEVSSATPGRDTAMPAYVLASVFFPFSKPLGIEGTVLTSPDLHCVIGPDAFQRDARAEHLSAPRWEATGHNYGGIECTAPGTAGSNPSGRHSGWAELGEADVDAVLDDLGTYVRDPIVFTRSPPTSTGGSSSTTPGCEVTLFPDGFTSVGTTLARGGCDGGG